MTDEADIFLVAGPGDRFWPEVVKEALTPLQVRVVSPDDVFRNMSRSSRNLILLDAGAVDNVPFVVARIRSQNPEARVVVASMAPTWDHAREAFAAGAIDYQRKSVDLVETRDAVQSALAKRVPRWP